MSQAANVLSFKINDKDYGAATGPGSNNYLTGTQYRLVVVYSPGKHHSEIELSVAQYFLPRDSTQVTTFP